MTDSLEDSVPYKVVYSGVFRTVIRDFAARATAAGQRDTFVAALKDLEQRLRIYPQFGEPELDLLLEDGQLYNGTVPPFVVRYAVFEERRLVFVGSPPKLLPNAGF